jgi:hypothetical protein
MAFIRGRGRVRREPDDAVEIDVLLRLDGETLATNAFLYEQVAQVGSGGREEPALTGDAVEQPGPGDAERGGAFLL